MEEKRFKCYESVWIMLDNKPRKYIIFAVIESMNFMKSGTELVYRLVKSRIGAGWGNDEGLKRSSDDVFLTREKLLETL